MGKSKRWIENAVWGDTAFSRLIRNRKGVVPMIPSDAHRFYQEKMPVAGFQPQLWAEAERFGGAYSNVAGDYVIVAAEAPNGHSAVTVTESRIRRVVVESKPAEH